MGQTLRQLKRASALIALAALIMLPLLWSLLATLPDLLAGGTWQALLDHPQTLGALGLSLWTGATSSLLAALLAAALLGKAFGKLHGPQMVRLLSPMLATPHAAFAIGMVMLLAPSGWLLRILSPWATGLTAPPPWPLTQDPWGLGLILVLVLKEVPFLLWVGAAQLQRPDVAQRLSQDMQVATSMGYGRMAAWWRIAVPVLARRTATPLLAVLAYGLGNVDMALIAGPTNPPTLAVLCWQWLLDADPALNSQGVTAAWLLVALLLACIALALTAQPAWRRWVLSGAPAPRSTATGNTGLQISWQLLRGDQTLALIYAIVLLALLLASLQGPWPFPDLWPTVWTTQSWQTVLGSTPTITLTLGLALLSSACALLWTLAWLELSAGNNGRLVRGTEALLLLPLALPAVLWVAGLHQWALAWGMDSSFTGVWLAHTLAVVPYTWLSLQGPYRAFDVRLIYVARSLGHGPWTALWRVKWPLLRAPLAAALAVGFAVSVAQYLPTLYIGGGRFNTVTTEAMALASGGHRSLAAAYAWLQWLLPALVFAMASQQWTSTRAKMARSPVCMPGK